jgi:DNA-binding transcriptional LysR family regulator
MHGMPLRREARVRRSGSAPIRRVPSWDDIRFFLAIHRAGSLSAAAGPLEVTQPTCGRRLVALETALGLRLFDRTPDGLRITTGGETLLDAAKQMEESAEDLALRATLTDRDLEGLVRIATTELFACSFLVGALEQVREKYPRIGVELVLSNTESDLLRREADIAFRFGPEASRPRSSTLVARRLGDEPFLLYGADTYLDRRSAPADPNDLADHDVVLYAGRHPAAEWCARAFARATVALSAPSMQVAGAAIAAGLGLGVLPKRAARLFPALRPLSAVVAQGTGWLIVHPDLRRVPRVRVVVDTLAAVYRADRRTGRAALR